MPYYDLEKVKVAARLKNIEYRGYKLYRDIANLGYELHDVADCIAHLKTFNFSKTINYNDHYDDVYIAPILYGYGRQSKRFERE